MSTKFIESTALPLFCAFVAGFCSCLIAVENERRTIQEAAKQAQEAPPVIITDCRTLPGEIVFATE